MIDIHINWEGPFTHSEALNLNSKCDYGLYTFYGDHLMYGKDVLLYLGKAEKQTFGIRIRQHNWELWTSGIISLYVGRIASKTPLIKEDWHLQISLAEKIILQSHNPSFNSSNLNTIGYRGEDTRILNWGKRKLLLPEVSMSRWEGEYSIGNHLRDVFKVQSIF